MADLGDAPDSTNNFPGVPMFTYGGGVLALFPTVYNDPADPAPYHQQAQSAAWLGKSVTVEDEADMGWDSDGVNNIDPSAAIDNSDLFDDGLRLPLQMPICGSATLDYDVTAVTPVNKWLFNVWVDFNRDGDWEDSLSCIDATGSPVTVTEWAVQNQIVNAPVGFSAFTTVPFAAMNPMIDSPLWVRATLTTQPAPPSPSTGVPAGGGPAGGYMYGETEDYYVFPVIIILPPTPTPTPNEATPIATPIPTPTPSVSPGDSWWELRGQTINGTLYIHWIANQEYLSSNSSLAYTKQITVEFALSATTPLAQGTTTANFALPASFAWQSNTPYCALMGGLSPSANSIQFDGRDDYIDCYAPSSREAARLFEPATTQPLTSTISTCKDPFITLDAIVAPATGPTALYTLFADEFGDMQANLHVRAISAQTELRLNGISHLSDPWAIDGINRTQGWSGEGAKTFLARSGLVSGRSNWYDYLRSSPVTPDFLSFAAKTNPADIDHWWTGTGTSTSTATTISQPWPGSFTMSNGPFHLWIGGTPSSPGTYFAGEIVQFVYDPSCPGGGY